MVPARVRLALIVFATLSILGASGVILFAKPEPATRVSPDGFAGAVSPSDIAVRDFSLRDQDGKPASLREYRGRVVKLMGDGALVEHVVAPLCRTKRTNPRRGHDARR